eukprot:Sspe_Gene.75010::Locus_46870_Transcript_1_1_Confidence_1.000_Length_1127::g.75010::m.75010
MVVPRALLLAAVVAVVGCRGDGGVITGCPAFVDSQGFAQGAYNDVCVCLKQIHEETGVSAGVAFVDTTGGADLEGFTKQLMQDTFPEAEKRSMVLFSITERKMRAQGIAPKAAQQLMDDTILKDFLRDGDYGKAALYAAEFIGTVLRGKEPKDTMPLLEKVIAWAFLAIMGGCGLFVLAAFFSERRHRQRLNRLQELGKMGGFSKDDICGICLSKLNRNKPVPLVCGHTFHTRCIADWLKQKDVCPLCRRENPSDMPDGTPPVREPVRHSDLHTLLDVWPQIYPEHSNYEVYSDYSWKPCENTAPTSSSTDCDSYSGYCDGGGASGSW